MASTKIILRNSLYNYFEYERRTRRNCDKFQARNQISNFRDLNGKTRYDLPTNHRIVMRSHQRGESTN